jgi:hypothetical protein
MYIYPQLDYVANTNIFPTEVNYMASNCDMFQNLVEFYRCVLRIVTTYVLFFIVHYT